MSSLVDHKVDPESGTIYGRRGKPVGYDCHGYVHVRTGRFTRFAHHLVWESVHGPIPAGMEINHINGIKSDNRIANLELVTRGENIAHAYRTGLRDSSGENNARAKLTETNVRAIRSSPRVARRVLADRYGVSVDLISAIRGGRAWRNVV